MCQGHTAPNLLERLAGLPRYAVPECAALPAGAASGSRASATASNTELLRVPRVSDPIRGILGAPAAELFTSGKVVVTHGPLERLPAFLRSGPMASIDALARHYVGPVEVAQGTATDGIQVPVADVHPTALLRLGLTVYFTELRRSLPDSREFLRALESALGLPECTTLSAFTNAPGSGLALHHDRFDQLLFQIHGKKRFRYAVNGFVANPDIQFSPFAAALPEFGQTYRHGFPPSTEGIEARGLETVLLEPGSAMFTPAGTWHTTAEQDERALSVVVVVRAPSRLDIALNLLRYYASQAPEWRARPYGGFAVDPATKAAEHETLARLLGELGARLPSLPSGRAFDAWRSHGHSVGALADYPRDVRFERYIRIPNSSLTFKASDAGDKIGCIVQSGPTSRPQLRTELAVNEEARPVLEWVLVTHRAFSLDEAASRFPEFTRDDLGDLFSWLAQAALIRPLPAPEWEAH